MQKQVAVIGGGVVGVCSAYFLARAGHEVVVIERRGNVAEESSFGNAGVLAPGYATPWAAPGVARRLLSSLFRSDAPVLFNPTLDPAFWRWMRMSLSESDLAHFLVNKTRMQRIAAYSQTVLRQLRTEHPFDYERTEGHLQLFRSERDLKLAAPLVEFMTVNNLPHQLLSADQARLVEPALASNTPLAGGLYLAQDEAGNCPLFTKHLKQLAQAMGVQFHFSRTLLGIDASSGHLTLRLRENDLENLYSADAVVLAAGIDSAQLLKGLGIEIPMYPVKGYSATAQIKNFDAAPRASLMDEAYAVALTRMGTRIRIAGLAEFGARTPALRERALHTLRKVGADWFPDAANYNKASFWTGILPMLPDGPPLLGATPIKNLYVNIGHGSAGWAMAAGSGKVLADCVSGKEAEIDLQGLTLARYGR